ncbi:putative ribonuclease H-like domain-containing protein [Tanacetum coccineum]
MEFESAHSNNTAKLPILKLGEYEMWVIRIKQYFQIQDYALWEVIKTGNSCVFVPQIAQENGTSVIKMSVFVTAEEKTNKKNDVKARSLLFMALPNEHQLTFSQYTDAKTILPPEWNTHVVVWMNKAEIETMSIDDLYNNFKIVEQSVNKSIGASSGAQNLAFMTAPSTSSTNDVNTAIPAYEVSTASPNVNATSPQVSTASFSDNVLRTSSNKHGSNGMKGKEVSIRDRQEIFINAKILLVMINMVDVFNCHKMGHFARECRAPRNKEGQFKNQDNTRKQGNNEDTSSKVMLAIDGVGFDWSDMAEEPLQTNMALSLMAFSDSKLNQTEFIAATYKRGLATVEEQLITYRKNEVLFSKEVAVLKREKFDNASKSLNQLLESQITDKSKKGLGYNAVPPPHPLIYNRPKKHDLSYYGLDEFKDTEFKSYGSEENAIKASSCWVWRPTKPDSASITLKKHNYIDARGRSNGCSRHMTGNIAYSQISKNLMEVMLHLGEEHMVVELLKTRKRSPRNPEEDPEEELELNNGLVNQSAPHLDPHQPDVMIGWLEENDGANEGVNNEDIKNEDVELKPRRAELIFPYELERQNPPPESRKRGPTVQAPEDTFGLLPKGLMLFRAFPRVYLEEEEPTSAHDSSYVGGLAPWALRHQGKREREIPNHDLGNVEHVLGDVLERLKVLESRENATSKKKLVEAEMKLELARMEHDMVERRLHASYGWNKRFYMEMVRIGAVPKPPSDDEGTERPRKKSKKSSFDGTEGPSEPRGPPSDS